mgnify:CR=1 FL=1
MKKFEHFRPDEMNALEEGYTHRLELTEKGELIGFADFEYHNKPFPCYYVSIIFVREKHRGQGAGGEILDTVNTFLKGRNAAGMLVDSIDPRNPAAGMYERNGWQAIPDQNQWYTFNLPEGVASGRLAKVIYQIRKSHQKELKKEKAA